MENKCENCEWWCEEDINIDEGKYGSCHRMPPGLADFGIDNFPLTHKYAWCGEFSPAEIE